MVRRVFVITLLLVSIASGIAFGQGIFIPSDGAWIDSRKYTNFPAANAAAVASGRGLSLSTQLTISTGMTITVPMTITKGGGIILSSSPTVTVSGLFNAAAQQVFTGTGTVRFSSGAIDHPVLAEWFGAKGDANRTTGDGTDDSAALQAAVDSIGGASGSGGTLLLLNKVYKGNFVIKSNVTVEGQGQEKTVLIPATNDAVIKTPTDVSTVRIKVKDLTITGLATQATYTLQDGLVLRPTTTATWVDDAVLERVSLTYNGRYGLWAYGETSWGPFTQHLQTIGCLFNNNTQAGLRLEGAIYETTLINQFVQRNGTAAGTYRNAEMILNATGGGRVERVGWYGGAVNHFLAISTGNTGTALYIAQANGVNLVGVDFESGNPMLELTGSVLQSVVVSGSRFGSSYAAASYVNITGGTAIKFHGNTFSGSPAPTRYIWQPSGSIGDISHISIDDSNYFGLNNSRPVTLVSSQTISGGVVRAYRNLMYIDTEGAAASDYLDYLADHAGDISVQGKIPPEALVTMCPANASHNIAFRHAVWNLYLSSSATFTAADIHDCLTVQRQSGAGRDVWVEYSRTKVSP